VIGFNLFFTVSDPYSKDLPLLGYSPLTHNYDIKISHHYIPMTTMSSKRVRDITKPQLSIFKTGKGNIWALF